MLTLAAAVFCLFSYAHAEAPIEVPAEVLQSIQAQFPESTLHMKPSKENIKIAIKSGKSSQTIEVGTELVTLDLANYVDSKQKSFEITMVPPFAMAESTQLHFINRYKPVLNRGKSAGLPCGKALKIQSQMGKLFSTQGIKLMTKDGHYLNLLGGDFVLTHLEGQQLRIVHFKITDSRYANRLCNIGL